MMMKSYVVVGLGRFGSCLARRLSALGAEVLAIDTSSELVQQIANSVTRAVMVDAQDKEALRALGVQNCDCAVVAIGGHLSSSVLATMNLKELGVPNVICKAHDETHQRVLERLGADRTIIPEGEVAERLAHSLSATNVLEYIELSKDYGIVEVPVPKKWVSKSLRDLNVRAKMGVNILAVRTPGGAVNVSPHADYRMQADDVLVILGDYKALALVQKL